MKEGCLDIHESGRCRVAWTDVDSGTPKALNEGKCQRSGAVLWDDRLKIEGALCLCGRLESDSCDEDREGESASFIMQSLS